MNRGLDTRRDGTHTEPASQRVSVASIAILRQPPA